MEKIFSDNDKRDKEKECKFIDELYKQIGKKDIEIEWLKKRWDYLSKNNHLTAHKIAESYLDRSEKQISLSRQCKLLGIGKSSVYYQPCFFKI